MNKESPCEESLANLAHFVDVVDSKLQRPIELHDQIAENPKIKKDLLRTNIYSIMSSLNFIQALFNWFYKYAMQSYQPMNSQMSRLFAIVSFATLSN